ncbi:MAG: ketoacyl-ACP synthase III [Candidatus Zixiibacteriota bacterium]|nr:MAG: ketoacyl-ACP synthase III [candidate division Zixibacteria bacterium]
MNGKYVRIIGTGSSVPDRVLTNADLEKMVETSDEWITARTGIKERRIAPDGLAASDYAHEASLKAMEMAGISADDLDLIILGTVTPDAPLPSTACILQDKLKAKNAAVVDIVAACSGFIYGLEYAKAIIQNGQKEKALVIGVETLSKIVNWKDRNTCVLFGDGAGAAVLAPSDTPGGILATYTKADGSLARLLQVPAGGGRLPLNTDNIGNGDRFIQMQGPEVFKSAVRAMEEAAVSILKQSGTKSGDIDLMIPHQANIRIIEATAKRIKLPMDRVFVNIHKYGNTSAASVPIALDEAVRSNRIRPGDKIMMVSFGAGFTWGSVLVEW